MNFLDRVDAFLAFDVHGYLDAVTSDQVKRSLNKPLLNRFDFLHLISPAAEPFLEEMATRARRETIQYFGRTVGLYAPIYISDYCANGCVYCGFNAGNHFKRTTLSLEEIEEECRILAATGIRHTMLLTGEAPLKTPLNYLESAVKIMKRYFASISLEIFPMDRADYEVLNRAGADALTVYQEVYDRDIYREVHPSGKKADYAYRLATPERGAEAGFRSVNIGTLFGLGDLCREVYLMACHARFLERKVSPCGGGALHAPHENGHRCHIPPEYLIRLSICAVHDRSSHLSATHWHEHLHKGIRPVPGSIDSSRDYPAFRRFQDRCGGLCHGCQGRCCPV